MKTYNSHLEFVHDQFEVIAETDNGILYTDGHEIICEIEGYPYSITDKDEFYECCETLRGCDQDE